MPSWLVCRSKMPIIVLRPDNFLDPDAKFSRIVQATTGFELLEKAKEVYRLQQTEGRAEIHIYTSSVGYTNRTRLDTLDLISGTDPMYGWVFVRPIRPIRVLPSEDLAS